MNVSVFHDFPSHWIIADNSILTLSWLLSFGKLTGLEIAFQVAALMNIMSTSWSLQSLK